MPTIKNLLSKVKAVDLEREVPEVVKSTSGTLISLQQKRLFNTGRDTEGKIIGFYSLGTEILSKGRKKFGNHYTLFDTGAFYRGMTISVDRDRIIFDSTDSKTGLLEDEYGSKIFGLDQKDRSYYISVPGLFFSKIKAYITGKTGLTFKR